MCVVGGMYYATHLERVPITGRTHFVGLSAQAELQLGESAHHSLRKQYAGRILPEHHPATQAVKYVGNRIIKSLNTLSEKDQPARLENISWEFTVIDSPEINAFVLPGGKVYVFTGLLGVASSPDELGTVLGHEIAHILARHAAEKITQGFLLNLVKLLLLSVIGFDMLHIFSTASVLGLELPFSRKCESEADVMGMTLMARACFDPRVAPGMFQKLGRLEREYTPPSYLNTHPPHAERTDNMRNSMQNALNQYESSGCTNISSRFFNAIQ